LGAAELVGIPEDQSLVVIFVCGGSPSIHGSKVIVLSVTCFYRHLFLPVFEPVQMQ
jgi:hypothetical protein